MAAAEVPQTSPEDEPKPRAEDTPKPPTNRLKQKSPNHYDQALILMLQ